MFKSVVCVLEDQRLYPEQGVPRPSVRKFIFRSGSRVVRHYITGSHHGGAGTDCPLGRMPDIALEQVP